MKIGILLHPYGERAPAGLGRIAYEVAYEFMRLYPEHDYIVYLKGRREDLPSFPAPKVHFHFLPEGFLWLDRGFLVAPKADIYLFNTPTLPLMLPLSKTVVLSLDYAYWIMPAKGLLQRVRTACLYVWHALSLIRADAVVAISEATRRDTLSLFRLRSDKVRTIYFGFKHICELPAEQVPVPADYFLFPGVWKERKNVHGVVDAFARYRASGGKAHLVLTGSNTDAYGQSVRSRLEKQGIAPYAHSLGHVSDGQLSYLYKHARALVFPSYIEGFGYPVLEAMDCGVPVITSNRSSLPELAGDAGIVVDPDDSEALADAMTRVFDAGVRTEMRLRGKEHSAHFSWEKGIRALHDLFLSIV